MSKESDAGNRSSRRLPDPRNRVTIKYRVSALPRKVGTMASPLQNRNSADKPGL